MADKKTPANDAAKKAIEAAMAKKSAEKKKKELKKRCASA